MEYSKLIGNITRGEQAFEIVSAQVKKGVSFGDVLQVAFLLKGDGLGTEKHFEIQ